MASQNLSGEVLTLPARRFLSCRAVSAGGVKVGCYSVVIIGSPQFIRLYFRLIQSYTMSKNVGYSSHCTISSELQVTLDLRGFDLRVFYITRPKKYYN